MRGAEKEIKENQEIVAIMQRAKICRIALVDGYSSYIVPVNLPSTKSIFIFIQLWKERKSMFSGKITEYVSRWM